MGSVVAFRKPWLRDARWLPLALLLGAGAGLAIMAAEPGAAPFPTGGAEAHKTRPHARGDFRLCGGLDRLNCVIDGDTIRYDGIKVRLADIDAPEAFSPKCPSEAALGQRATQRLIEVLNAGPFQVVRSGDRDEDRYGRKLRVIERGGRSVADTLVAEGLARRWDGARRSWCG